MCKPISLSLFHPLNAFQIHISSALFPSIYLSLIVQVSDSEIKTLSTQHYTSLFLSSKFILLHTNNFPTNASFTLMYSCCSMIRSSSICTYQPVLFSPLMFLVPISSSSLILIVFIFPIFILIPRSSILSSNVCNILCLVAVLSAKHHHNISES